MAFKVQLAREKMESPDSETEEDALVGAIDLNDLTNELEHDELDGPLNGKHNEMQKCFRKLIIEIQLLGERPAIMCPPESEWYNGRLDRYSAEQRLKSAYKLGSYLVRESDRKPGSYVLCYLGRTGINHFRITAVCGDFYIGGRQFFSLSDLVGYYTSCSDLLKRERLVFPVAPPEPVNDKKVLMIYGNDVFWCNIDPN